MCCCEALKVTKEEKEKRNLSCRGNKERRNSLVTTCAFPAINNDSFEKGKRKVQSARRYKKVICGEGNAYIMDGNSEY
jgi:hypothetical protein